MLAAAVLCEAHGAAWGGTRRHAPARGVGCA